jgi:hypothetical protein
MMRKLLFCLLALLFAGCASVPMGDAKRDAELKNFTPNSDKAGVYVYRNEVIGAAIKMDVELDGKHLGRTASKVYLYTEVAPGKHTIVSRAENEDTLELEVMAGKLYYVWQEVKMGLWSARSKLSLMTDEEGKKGVSECQLAETK